MMFVYDRLRARTVAAGLAVLVVLLVGLVGRRVCSGAGRGLLRAAGLPRRGLVGAVLVSLVIGRWLGRPNGWYAHPWVGALAYGASAVAAAVAAQAPWGRGDDAGPRGVSGGRWR